MGKIQFVLGTVALVLLSACNKVEGGKIKQGEYSGTITVYVNNVVNSNVGAKIELEKNTFEAELRTSSSASVAAIEGEGNFDASKDEITFNLSAPSAHAAMPSGSYKYELHNKGKHLIMYKVVDNKRYEFDGVRVDD